MQNQLYVNELNIPLSYMQARTSADSGTVLMKRSLLVKAGQALSPDAFMLVLESEREPKGNSGLNGDYYLHMAN